MRGGAVAAAVAMAALAACSAGSGPPPPEPGPDSGGTITYLQYQPPEHLDPQRMYVARDIANLGRLAYRSLVALPSSSDPAVASTPVADLATDTGTHDDDDTVWSFTLKRDVRWQDGRAVTCADLKYGASRSFATDVITGGPDYARQYLDIPVDPRTGRSVYTGPYRHTAAGQAAFDRAVTCAGRTITYHFKRPWPDFPLAVATLAVFDPYRADLDRGNRSNEDVFSDGPYRMLGTFSDRTGFTMVRNPSWDPSTDPIRQAYPERFAFEYGMDPDTQADRLIADQLPDAVGSSSIPATDVDRITGGVADRAALVDSTFTDYLMPSSRSQTMSNPQVRLALAQATDRHGYSLALSGTQVSKPSYSIVAPGVPGYARNPAFADIPPAGDVIEARATLKTSGAALPVPIRFVYNGGTPETERAALALKRSWDAAGFEVTLNEVTGLDYCVIPGGCRFPFDVALFDTGADWPSIGSVIPPVFDSRVPHQLTYGGFLSDDFDDPDINHRIDDISAITDRATADAAWAGLDAWLGRAVAYIPLDVPQLYLLRGSNVDGYVSSVGTSGYPDLAAISLKNAGS